MRPRSIRLYIPLCLYFNLIMNLLSLLEILNFTFHYVSILIVQRVLYSGWGLTFTFHYVSILISSESITLFLPPHFTFHYVSILIIGVPDVEISHYLLYIPLCLYFNEILGIEKKCNFTVFTFHYVSILMQISDWLEAKGYDLYIPLCLYFNGIAV